MYLEIPLLAFLRRDIDNDYNVANPLKWPLSDLWETNIPGNWHNNNLAHNRHLRSSATKLRTVQQILILQDNAALQSNYNVFYVHRYAFYDQFAIKWCLIRCYRYNWSEVIGVERSWEAKSLVPPTVQRPATCLGWSVSSESEPRAVQRPQAPTSPDILSWLGQWLTMELAGDSEWLTGEQCDVWGFGLPRKQMFRCKLLLEIMEL